MTRSVHILLLIFLLCSLRNAGAQPTPGQIVIDPEHPRWLKRHEGKHLFICGPGDPEGFLYRGKRLSDGTRDGDQVDLIQKLIEHGGNCLYLQMVRSHGGDGERDHNPFVDSDPRNELDPDILNQWEQWFSLMDQHHILIYLFFYDDSARIWNTGDTVGAHEQAFLQTIVRKFKHHKNLIWIVAEESEERYSTARVQAIARVIHETDDHRHLIGNHHHSGIHFKAWQPDGYLNHFAMQLGVEGDAAHHQAIEAFRTAGDQYQIIYSENTAGEPTARYAWRVAMAGLMPMMFEMDVATTPIEELQRCRYLQRFFEDADFFRLSPHDELAHGGTKWVLAEPGASYIAYAEDLNGQLGLKQMEAGQYRLTWLDCASGRRAGQSLSLPAGDQTFEKPKPIGNWCALWITRGKETASYFPPPESAGGWRKLESDDDIRHLGQMDPVKLKELEEWLLASDKRDFAAVVIRNGYIVLEVERGNSAKTDSRRVASVSKAICATVLAIAAEQSQEGRTPKKMSFDDPAFDFIPWAHPLSDPRKSKITVRQLFNHTSGLTPESTGARNEGPWRHVLGHDGDPRTARLAFDPGTKSGYSTFALYHAALVCEHVTGLPYDQFAIQSLFKPIGCEHWWFQHFDGGADGKYGRHPNHSMGMPARDLARIAYCMLRNGRWGERQVIPEWFVRETAAPTHGLKMPELRFYHPADSFSHAWELPARRTSDIPEDARFKPGSGGQLIAFVPSLDLVITRQTGSSGSWQYDEYLRRACLATLSE